MSIRSVTPSPLVRTKALRVGVHPQGLRRRLEVDALGPEDGVEGIGEIPGTVADQMAEAGGVLAEVGQKVAGALGGEGRGRMLGDAEEVHSPAGVFDHEEDTRLRISNAVDLEEDGDQDSRGLGAQECAPTGCVRA